jgi:hypothetical protein
MGRIDVSFTLLMLSLATALLPGSSGSVQAAAKPNILFVLTNDQHTAMLRHMPRVQAELRAKGTKFETL